MTREEEAYLRLIPDPRVLYFKTTLRQYLQLLPNSVFNFLKDQELSIDVRKSIFKRIFNNDRPLYFDQIDRTYKLLTIDDFWRLIKGVIHVPNESNIVRRFKHRVESQLIDLIDGRDAQLLTPVSTIDVDSVIEFDDLSDVTIESYSGNQLLSISGNSIISSGSGYIFDLKLSDGTYIPLPHLKYDISGNNNDIISLTNIDTDYVVNGSLHLINYGCIKRGDTYIPNNINAIPIDILLPDDILINGSTFINQTPFKLKLFESPQINYAYSFFDKSDNTIWGDNVRLADTYDSNNSGVLDFTELIPQYGYNNIIPPYKYRFWSRIIDNGYEDILLYNINLSNENICYMKNYVTVGEMYSSLLDGMVLCDNDILV